MSHSKLGNIIEREIDFREIDIARISRYRGYCNRNGKVSGFFKFSI